MKISPVEVLQGGLWPVPEGELGPALLLLQVLLEGLLLAAMMSSLSSSDEFPNVRQIYTLNKLKVLLLHRVGPSALLVQMVLLLLFTMLLLVVRMLLLPVVRMLLLLLLPSPLAGLNHPFPVFSTSPIRIGSFVLISDSYRMPGMRGGDSEVPRQVGRVRSVVGSLLHEIINI